MIPIICVRVLKMNTIQVFKVYFGFRTRAELNAASLICLIDVLMRKDG